MRLRAWKESDVHMELYNHFYAHTHLRHLCSLLHTGTCCAVAGVLPGDHGVLLSSGHSFQSTHMHTKPIEISICVQTQSVNSVY